MRIELSIYMSMGTVYLIDLNNLLNSYKYGICVVLNNYKMWKVPIFLRARFFFLESFYYLFTFNLNRFIKVPVK
jgi:hypothetical protein